MARVDEIWGACGVASVDVGTYIPVSVYWAVVIGVGGAGVIPGPLFQGGCPDPWSVLLVFFLPLLFLLGSFWWSFSRMVGLGRGEKTRQDTRWAFFRGRSPQPGMLAGNSELEEV